jgi:DNA-binding beta-propeller fold protein YncE
VEIDGQKMVSSRRYPIGGCHYAADLAIDTKNGRLYTSCFNDKRSGGTILASDFVSGRVLGTVTLSHVRFLVFDDGYAFSTGEDGTITVIGETSADKFEVVGTIETQANSSATELAVDPTTHKLYVCVGGPATKDKTGEEVRPWSVWIFGRQPAIP